MRVSRNEALRRNDSWYFGEDFHSLSQNFEQWISN